MAIFLISRRCAKVNFGGLSFVIIDLTYRQPIGH
jgi:hypothetical protein